MTESLGPEVDSCFFPASRFPYRVGSGESDWPVASNGYYGADDIVDSPGWVNYMFNAIYYGYTFDGCGEYQEQTMYINGCGEEGYDPYYADLPGPYPAGVWLYQDYYRYGWVDVYRGPDGFVEFPVSWTHELTLP